MTASVTVDFAGVLFFLDDFEAGVFSDSSTVVVSWRTELSVLLGFEGVLVFFDLEAGVFSGSSTTVVS